MKEHAMKTTVLLASTLMLAALAGCNRPDGSGPTPKTAVNTTTSAPPLGSALSAPVTPATDPLLADANSRAVDGSRDTGNLPTPSAPDTANAPGSPPNPQSAPQPSDQPQVNAPRDAKNYAG
jgi:hypothetical protein